LNRVTAGKSTAMDLVTVLLIVLIVLLLFGGVGYRGRRRL
jgi:hypothetical protein